MYKFLDLIGFFINNATTKLKISLHDNDWEVGDKLDNKKAMKLKLHPYTGFDKA